MKTYPTKTQAIKAKKFGQTVRKRKDGTWVCEKPKVKVGMLYGADADMTVTSTRERTRIALCFLPKGPEEAQMGGENAGKDENICGC